MSSPFGGTSFRVATTLLARLFGTMNWFPSIFLSLGLWSCASAPRVPEESLTDAEIAQMLRKGFFYLQEEGVSGKTYRVMVNFTPHTVPARCDQLGFKQEGDEWKAGLEACFSKEKEGWLLSIWDGEEVGYFLRFHKQKGVWRLVEKSYTIE